MALTVEAREAIRSYMTKIVVLPVGVLSAIGFALGWFINEGALGAAYGDAFSDAQKSVVEMATGAATAAANADQARKQADAVLKKALESAARIEKQEAAALAVVKDLAKKTNIEASDVSTALKPIFEKELSALIAQSVSTVESCTSGGGKKWYHANAVCPSNNTLIGRGCSFSDWVANMGSNAPEGNAWQCSSYDSAGHSIKMCARAICLESGA